MSEESVGEMEYTIVNSEDGLAIGVSLSMDEVIYLSSEKVDRHYIGTLTHTIDEMQNNLIGYQIDRNSPPCDIMSVNNPSNIRFEDL